MMRPGDFVEKRKFKRLDLALPMKIRRTSGDGEEDIQEGVTINVSFNGAYVVNVDVRGIEIKDKLNISLSVPRDDTRDFPFSRLVGKARVIRVEKDGIALEFSEDIYRLFVASN